MKTMSIHGVDRDMSLKIKEKSAEYGLSANKTIKRILADSLGLAGEKSGPNSDFENLCGALPAAEAAELEKSLSDMDVVDTEAWS
ncbi:MAG: hypothetical protein PHI34_11595 [Acidobacteriota bacterium]|nr:hypothetical protein [Acidobacteriota bacterium]